MNNKKNSAPKKVNKVVYAILTILLGCIGVNKFYEGKVKQGIVSLLFCWTGIPFILSVAEFITVLTEKADKNNMIPVSSKRRTNVAYATSMILFVLFIIFTIIPWESLFTNCTIFTDLNEWLNGLKIGSYSVFGNIIGKPVVVDATYGSTTGVIQALGSWSMTDVAILLMILSAVIAVVNKVKFNDFIAASTSGIKKALPIAITAMFVSIVLVVMVTTGVNITIVNAILSMTEKFNLLTASLGTLVGSVLTSDFYYFVSTVGGLFSAAAGSTEYYGVVAFIMQSLFNLIMVIAPTSVGLVIGLYYMDIPYTKWIKYIWKAFLVIFVVVLITAIIIYALV